MLQTLQELLESLTSRVHMIRNASTNQYRAVTALHGLIRLVSDRTSIQNSLEDLGSLITYLRLPMLSEAAQFRRHIIRRTGVTLSNQQPNFENLRLLLGAVCLRRNKTILPISQSDDLFHTIEFSWSKRQEYERLGRSWRQALDLAVSGHKSKEARQTFLKALLRMRIYCNNGDIFGDGYTSFLTEPDERESLLQQRGGESCYYCSCDISSFGVASDNHFGSVTACHHAVCGDCYHLYQKTIREHDLCPICGKRHESLPSRKKEQEHLESYMACAFPPKLMALCKDIDRYRNESKR